MTYPATKETFDRPVNATWNPALNAGLGGWEGGSFPDAVETGAWLTVVETLEDVVGLAGADPGSGSHEARLNRLEGDTGSHFSVQDGDATSPLLGDLQVRTDLTPWQMFGYGPDGWALVGADAVSFQGVPIERADPTADGQVPTFDVASGLVKWMDPGGAASDSFAGLITVKGMMVRGKTADGTPEGFPVGPEGDVLSVVTGQATWAAPPWALLPIGLQPGDTFWWNGTILTRLAPGASGQWMQTQGSSGPRWHDLPVSSPGSAIAAPAGSVQGNFLLFTDPDWDNFGNPSDISLDTWFIHWNAGTGLPEWAHLPSSSGMSNPMSHVAAVIIGGTSGAALELVAPVSGDQPDSVLGLTGGQVAWHKEADRPFQTFKDWVYQSSVPAAPAASSGRTYWKTDGKYYGKNAAGTEYDLTLAPGAGSAHVVQDEGTPLTARPNLNFVGAGVTVTDDSGNNASVVTIPTGGHVVQDEGTPLTQRANLNFAGTGVTVTDDSGNGASLVTIPGATAAATDYLTALWYGGN
jgi:hypothetical protein